MHYLSLSTDGITELRTDGITDEQIRPSIIIDYEVTEAQCSASQNYTGQELLVYFES